MLDIRTRIAESDAAFEQLIKQLARVKGQLDLERARFQRVQKRQDFYQTEEFALINANIQDLTISMEETTSATSEREEKLQKALLEADAELTKLQKQALEETQLKENVAMLASRATSTAFQSASMRSTGTAL
eukprot:m.369854 g.369854  ORF g.369854 m.369854 type:complete len:132 (-) comp51366_c0_seq1:114-509(-)